MSPSTSVGGDFLINSGWWDGESKEIRELREHKELRVLKGCRSSSLRSTISKFSNLTIFPKHHKSAKENLIVRLGSTQKNTPRDSTLNVHPRGITFSVGSRMTPYHFKLATL